MSVVLTNKHFLLFVDGMQNHVLKSRGVSFLAEYDLVFQEKLDDLQYEVKHDDTIVVYKNYQMILRKFDINQYFRKRV